MSLRIPGNIPVAARGLADIQRYGTIREVTGFDRADALASMDNASGDEVLIWARPTLRDYRRVWQAAALMGLVEAAEAHDTAQPFGVDIDHVFPKSWAKLPHYEVAYVRLYPAWSEVNRSAGGGRERLDPLAPGYKPNEIRRGIYFASDLQLRKMLGLPVGSTKDRSTIFD